MSSENLQKLKAIMEELARIESEYTTFFNVAPELFSIASIDGFLIKVNPSWERVLGYTAEELTAQPFIEFVHPEDREKTLRTLSTLATEGVNIPGFENRYIAKDGAIVHLRWDATNKAGHIYATAKDVTKNKRIETSLRLLSDTGKVLAESWEAGDTLQRVVSLFIPEFSDWCAIDIVQDDGYLKSAAIAHTDPEKIDYAMTLTGRMRDDKDAPEGKYKVMQTGVAEVYNNIAKDDLDATTENIEVRTAIEELKVRSVIIAPLPAWGKILGTITAISSDSVYTFTEEDVETVAEIGRRCGIAIYNSMMFYEMGKIFEGAKKYSHILKNIEAYLDESLEQIKLSKDRIAEVRKQVSK